MSTVCSYHRRAGPRDLLFLGRPDLWPLWPLLPLLRLPVGAPPEFGALLDRPGCDHTVFLADQPTLLAGGDQFHALPQLDYASLDELVVEGWHVD